MSIYIFKLNRTADMLRKQMGTAVLIGKLLPGSHEALVNKDVFDLVQTVLGIADNGRYPR